MLSRDPKSPNRPYLSWQRKIRIQLDELLEIHNPDSRTMAEIHRLQIRLQGNPEFNKQKKRRINK